MTPERRQVFMAGERAHQGGADASRVGVVASDRVIPVFSRSAGPAEEPRGAIWVILAVLAALVLLFFGAVWFLSPGL